MAQNTSNENAALQATLAEIETLQFHLNAELEAFTPMDASEATWEQVGKALEVRKHVERALAHMQGRAPRGG